jgi:transcriptional regulator of aromatic amino acid metabolism
VQSVLTSISRWRSVPRYSRISASKRHACSEPSWTVSPALSHSASKAFVIELCNRLIGTVSAERKYSRSSSLRPLRALENREVRPIGSERSRKVDVRTLFATHADLRHALNQGRFREDLYFRIAKITVELPPLRTRLQDIGLLLEKILEDLGRPGVKVDEAGMAVLLARSWPGNIRELKNLVEVALVGSVGDALSLEEALPAIHQKEEVACGRGLYEVAKKEFERRFYTGLYAACRGNVTRIAKVAGRQRVTVREALRDLGLYVAPESGGASDVAAVADSKQPPAAPYPSWSKDK